MYIFGIFVNTQVELLCGLIPGSSILLHWSIWWFVPSFMLFLLLWFCRINLELGVSTAIVSVIL
jgi:hypothetical protein